MAGDIKNKYGTNGQTLTCTMASLANNGAQASTAVDNTSNLYIDVLVMIKVKTGSSGTASTGYVTVYAYGTVDGGTTYTEGVSGTNGSATLTKNARPIGTIMVAANGTTYVGGPFSVAAAFNGVLPDHWGIIIENNTGGTLDSTEGNHAKLWQGVLAQYT